MSDQWLIVPIGNPEGYTKDSHALGSWSNGNITRLIEMDNVEAGYAFIVNPDTISYLVGGEWMTLREWDARTHVDEPPSDMVE